MRPIFPFVKKMAAFFVCIFCMAPNGATPIRDSANGTVIPLVHRSARHQKIGHFFCVADVPIFRPNTTICD